MGDRWRHGERCNRPHAAEAKPEFVSFQFVFLHKSFSSIANVLFVNRRFAYAIDGQTLGNRGAGHKRE
jgi:hypothetical protein